MILINLGNDETYTLFIRHTICPNLGKTLAILSQSHGKQPGNHHGAKLTP